MGHDTKGLGPKGRNYRENFDFSKYNVKLEKEFKHWMGGETDGR